MKAIPADQVPRQPVQAGTGVEWQLLIGADEAPHFAMRRFIIHPGGSMPLHTNQVEHEQFVLRGRARIEIGDHRLEVEAGHVVYIPAGVPHRYETVGEEPFEFLCMVPHASDRIELIDP